jgi:hypothetical protein
MGHCTHSRHRHVRSEFITDRGHIVPVTIFVGTNQLWQREEHCDEGLVKEPKPRPRKRVARESEED